MTHVRGISPVVATALLVLIAVAVSVLLYVWVSGIVSNQPESPPGLWERIKIDAVGIEGNKVVIYVHNIGNAAVELRAAYVIDARTNQILGRNTTLAQILGAGEVGSVTVTTSSDLVGRTIIVKVVTSNGVEATYITAIRG